MNEDINALEIGRIVRIKILKYKWDTIYRLTDVHLFKAIKQAIKNNIDIFTFIERRYISPLEKYLYSKVKSLDIPVFTFYERLAVLRIKSFDDWWHAIGKKTRNMVRKAIRKNATTEVVYENTQLLKNAKAIWKLYNETPIRQNKRYIGYGMPLEKIIERFRNLELLHRSLVVLARYNERVVGFTHIIIGDHAGMVRTFLSSIYYRNIPISNLMMAKVVEELAKRNINFLIYGHMGIQPGIELFKKNNGFKMHICPRYFIPITKKGMIILKRRAPEMIFPGIMPPRRAYIANSLMRLSKIFPHTIYRRIAS